MSPIAPYDNRKKIIYADHAATTPLDAEVLEGMHTYFSPRYGNPSSLHASGRRARSALEDARARIAACIGAASDEIIFTGSGTESDNVALVGAARALRARGSHIIISAIEHKAVRASAHLLEQEGFTVSIVPVDHTGMVRVADVLSLLQGGTILVSVMLANNEIGTVLPVAALAEALRTWRHEHGGLPLLHTDACQALGYLNVQANTLNVDLMTLNGSKAYGPKGVGVLYRRRDTPLTPLIVGGGQEGGLRAGTESVPLVAGMAAAYEKALRLQDTETRRLDALRDYFIAGLRERIPNILINGHKKKYVPHIVHVSVPRIEGESMVLMLDAAGIEAATGSACSTGDLKPSHVLTALGHSDELIHGSVRFSFGRGTTREDIDTILSVFPNIVITLTQASALTTNHYARYAKTS